MEPTIERTAENDPIMEDREDAVGANGFPSEERDAEESRENFDESAKEKEGDDLSTVKEETSNEAEEMAAEDVTSPQQKCTPSMDEDTMEYSAESHGSGYHTPATSPAFCNCFAMP